jgi:DNA polymerase-4
MRLRRIACIHIPHLPLQLERQLDPQLAFVPVLISGLAWRPDMMLDATEALAIPAGTSLHQAKQMCPQAKVIAPNEPLYFTEHETLRRIAEQFSPDVEDAGLGHLYLDVAEMHRLYPTEQDIALALLTAITQNTHLTARIGIAGNKFVAEQAARSAADGTAVLIRPGGEREFLSSLPLSALPGVVDHESLRRMTLLGIDTLGDLAVLSVNAVVTQFGRGARSLHDLARGIDLRPLDVTAPPPVITQVANFGFDPLRDRGALQHHVEALAKHVAHELDQSGYHAEGLRVTLVLSNHRTLERATTVKPPTAQTERVAGAALRVASFMDTPHPVMALAITAYLLHPWHAAAQQLAFGERLPDHKLRLEQAIESLKARFGEFIVRVATFLNQPRPLRIEVRADAQGRPKILSWNGWSRFVKRTHDHWRTTSRPWDKRKKREHYLVETQHGGRYSVFAETHEWYVDRTHPQ